MKIVFVVNPAAGKKNRSDEICRLVRQIMTEDGREYEIHITAAEGEGEVFCRELLMKDRVTQYLFVACGGDGTLNEVVNAVVGHDNAAVTHFPCGSGNDFIKCFPDRTADFFDMRKLIQGEPKEIDVLRCNERRCINICSVGLDARVAALVPVLKRYPLISGSGAYNLSLLINLCKRMSESYRIYMDGECYDGRYVIAVAANGTHYGGGFNPVPEADPTDGVLDVLLVKKLSRFVVAKVVGKYKNGRYKEVIKYFTRLSGRGFRLVAQKPVAVNMDGEIRMLKEVSISLTGEKLWFYLPSIPRAENSMAFAAAGAEN